MIYGNKANNDGKATCLVNNENSENTRGKSPNKLVMPYLNELTGYNECKTYNYICNIIF